MDSKFVEYFQQEPIDNEQLITPSGLPSIDKNYVILNRCIKFILNFLLIYTFTTLIIYNYPNTNTHVFVILICTISSVVFYMLDLMFPSCYI